jgi:hypothetical protein
MLLHKRIFAVSILGLLFSQLSSAQYGGPMGSAPMPGTPGYTAPSHGYSANKAAIGAGIGAGAGGGALFLALRHRGVHKGCVGSDGNSLTDKNGHRFQLEGSSLKPGEEVSVKTKKVKDDSSGSTLEVVDVKKDLGRCEEQRASR